MNRAFHNRCIILCLILVTLLSLLSARLVQIQVIDRKVYASSSARAYHRVEIIPAVRGMIVDRNDNPIAKSVPVSSMYVDKNHLMDPKLASFGLAFQEASMEQGWAQLKPDEQRRRIHVVRGEILAGNSPEVIVTKHTAHAVSLLSRAVGMRREEMRQLIENHRSKWFPIAKDIPDDIAERLRDIVDDNYLQGFAFENSTKRWYANPSLAAHLTGFTGEIEVMGEDGKKHPKIVGRFGVESAMEDFLAGRDGRQEHHRDARGLVVPGKVNSLLPPRPGLNARLTIDIGAQAIVEEELDAGLKQFKAKKGAIIVMDPKTGDILAMASRPHFDLNNKENLVEASFNYAIQARFEPGSTIKAIPYAAAIDQGLVSPTTMLNCPSVMQENKFTVKDAYTSGQMSVTKAVQKSNNVASWKMAKLLGKKRYYHYVHGFGLGEKSGILLSGENSGIAPIPELPIDFSRSAFGYYIGVTPIQMAAAYSVIAGDGRLLKPRIVKALVANDGTVIDDFPVEVRQRVIKKETAAKMRTILHQVTLDGGTATHARVRGFKVCGKTGTARKHDPKRGGYVQGAYVVSFAGFMPADDPAFVCYVVIDEPRTTEVKHYGGTIAAPIFAKVGERLATYMNLQPTEEIAPSVTQR